MNPADEIKALKEERDALKSQLVSGVSEAREVAIRQQITAYATAISNKEVAISNKEVATMKITAEDPWTLNNMSASLFKGAFLGTMGFGASTMFKLTMEGRFLSTIGGLWVGLLWGENGRCRGGWQ